MAYCPKCNGDMGQWDAVCPHCSYDFPPEPSSDPKYSTGSAIWLASKLILGILFGLGTVYYVWMLTYFVKVWAAAGYSPHAFTQTGGVLACVCICVTLTMCMFRSAFRKPTKPPRRWYQFSLRWLLLFGPLATICISWLIVAERELDQQYGKRAAIVTAILQSGGIVPSWQRDVSGSCCWVTLKSDAGLKFLASQRYLDEFECDAVNLQGPLVTDAGLEFIKAWPQVRCLTLRDTRITGSGLQHLQALPQLRHLNLICSGVSATGLDHAKGLLQLETLLLNGAGITDTHLRRLKGCVQLKTLTLVDTSVTDQGIHELQTALPNCRISH